jgi:hypothetical protein
MMLAIFEFKRFKSGILTYFLNASECHLPIIWIRSSEIPILAAVPNSEAVTVVVFVITPCPV